MPISQIAIGQKQVERERAPAIDARRSSANSRGKGKGNNVTPSDLLCAIPSVDELCQHVYVRRGARIVRANVVLMREFIAERIASSLSINGSVEPSPVAMILHCPECSRRHVDAGEFATRPHHTHACQHCGFVWRPAIVPTVGVQFLPGFKNEARAQ